VRVAFGKAGKLGRVKPSIHAGKNGKTAGGWKGKFAFVSEVGGVCLIGLEHF
jgi:hypothetical protein